MNFSLKKLKLCQWIPTTRCVELGQIKEQIMLYNNLRNNASKKHLLYTSSTIQTVKRREHAYYQSTNKYEHSY